MPHAHTKYNSTKIIRQCFCRLIYANTIAHLDERDDTQPDAWAIKKSKKKAETMANKGISVVL